MGAIKIPNNSTCGRNNTGNGGYYTLLGLTNSVYPIWGGYGMYQAVTNVSQPAYGFHIYQGARATQVELDAMVSVGVLASLPRYSDLLLNFSNINTPAPVVALSTMTALFNAASAIRSGTATWFMLNVVNPNNGFPLLITGDISLAGGGGDLILETTTINSGGFYRLPAINIPLATKITW